MKKYCVAVSNLVGVNQKVIEAGSKFEAMKERIRQHDKHNKALKEKTEENFNFVLFNEYGLVIDAKEV